MILSEPENTFEIGPVRLIREAGRVCILSRFIGIGVSKSRVKLSCASA